MGGFRERKGCLNMNFTQFSEVNESSLKRFSECPLSKIGEGKVFDKPMSDYDKPLAVVCDTTKNDSFEISNEIVKSIDVQEAKLPIQNKIDGLKREAEVLDELQKKYPESDGYIILSEVYLRDENGNIVKDPVTGEARRIDYVVIKDGKVVDSIEVTSKTADKTEQTAKEDRIRKNGGNYVKDSDGNLVRMSDDIHTRIERRE